ncbi:MAG: hypothetical protein MJ252_03660 [archaeon]|nr:hypothetical protein [archaeon]
MEASKLMDDLFAKITALQNEKKLLEEKQQNLNNKIREAKSKKGIEYWLNDRTKTQIGTLKQDEEKLKKDYDKIDRKIIKNSIEHTFEYIPIDSSINTVFISGDFNKWGMTEMERDRKNNHLFIHKAYLNKGYEYAYCYFADGMQLTDENLPIRKIASKGNSYFNIISVPDRKKKTIPLYDQPESELEKLKGPIEIIGDEDALLKNLLNFIKEKSKWNKDLRMLMNNKSVEMESQFHSEKNVSLEEHKDLFALFTKNFIGRVLTYKNQKYIFTGLNYEFNSLQCSPLYDCNGIKVNSVLQNMNKDFSYFNLSGLFEDINFLTKEESALIKSDFEKDTQSKLKILYILQDDPQNRGSKMIIPYKINPTSINMGNYDINVDDIHIKNVYNKISRCFINFEAICIGNVFPTLVPSTKIIVYTTQESVSELKVLHIHINDTGDEIAIDSAFLEDNESLLDHKVFEADFSGKMLNYKLLFQSNKLAKIYYAIGKDYIDEPEFTEIRFNQSTIARVLQGEYKGYLGRIQRFPEGMIVRKISDEGIISKKSSLGFNKEGTCEARHFEELPGYLSFSLVFTPLNEPMEKPVNISIPICHLSPLNVREEIEIQKIIVLKENLKNQEKVQCVEDVFDLCKKYSENRKLLEDMSMDELKKIMEKIENNINWEEYKIEGENVEDKIDYIVKTIPQLQMTIQQLIRMKAFERKK